MDIENLLLFDFIGISLRPLSFCIHLKFHYIFFHSLLAFYLSAPPILPKNQTNQLIKVLIINGHGCPEGIILSKKENGTIYGYEINELKNSFSYLKDQATIILNSCSTGKKSVQFPSFDGVAQRIANCAGNRVIYAPINETLADMSRIKVVSKGQSYSKIKPFFFDKTSQMITKKFKRKESPKIFVQMLKKWGEEEERKRSSLGSVQ